MTVAWASMRILLCVFFLTTGEMGIYCFVLKTSYNGYLLLVLKSRHHGYLLGRPSIVDCRTLLLIVTAHQVPNHTRTSYVNLSLCVCARMHGWVGVGECMRTRACLCMHGWSVAVR